MENKIVIRKALDIIDSRIAEGITPGELAKECGYSTIHFSRLFSGITGMTLMAYITRRKLQYALYDISCSEKIIDVAVKYSFETHAGFTRAFKKCFGYPPSIYRIHAICSRPTRMDLDELISIISGGILMYPEILQMEPITVVGFTTRHKIPNVKYTHDIPLYWDTINMDYGEPLTRLHDLFNKSKHCEITVCFDINSETGEFTYLLGVGVDNPEDFKKVESDMYVMKTARGLYARFTTPLIEDSKHIQAVRDTWNKIFDSWLPASGYAFDEKRNDFEYYDERDHISHNKGMVQIEIFIPIKKR
ncbi:MAG: effector binding domain-containing protein [Dehalococcoidales bacterium]|nr:effector binding domain-containing protein [Dehalococcoidales bacterium]